MSEATKCIYPFVKSKWRTFSLNLVSCVHVVNSVPYFFLQLMSDENMAQFGAEPPGDMELKVGVY